MLKKKGGPSFKPKAGIRRNVPPAPDRQSKTPAPAPQSTAEDGRSEAGATSAAVSSAVAGPAAPAVPAPAPPSSIPQADPAAPGDATRRATPQVEQPVGQPTAVRTNESINLASKEPATQQSSVPSETIAVVDNEVLSEHTSEHRRPSKTSGAGVDAGVAPLRPEPVIQPSASPVPTSSTTQKPSDNQRLPLHSQSELTSGEPVSAVVPSSENIPVDPAISQAPAPVQNEAATSLDPAADGPQARKRKAPTANSANDIAAEIQEESPAAPPAKKHRATKSRKGTTSTGETEHQDVHSTQTSQRPQRAARATAPATEETNGTSEQTDGVPSAPRKRQARPKKAANTARVATGNVEEVNGDVAPAKPRRRRRQPAEDAEPSPAGISNSGDSAELEEVITKKKPSKRPRKERSVTPEDAEERTIDPKVMTVGDLTKDLRYGKKFSRHDELVERFQKHRLSRKRKQDGASPAGDAENGASNEGGSDSAGVGSRDKSATPGAVAGTGATAPAAPALALTGPQFELVDGAIVVNQASLVHDRHAAAAAEQEGMEEVEENDFTRMTNAMTYLKPTKLRGPNAWTKEETETFYTYLEMMGSDFSLLTPMFPGRSRRHLKMKFNREERVNPARINAALLGPKRSKIDLDEYQSRTGTTLEATEDIEAAHRAREEAHEAEQRRIREEADQLQLEKRNKLLGTGGPSSPGGEADKDPTAGEKGGNGEELDEEEDVEIIDEAEVARPPPRRGGRRPAGGGIGS